MSILRSLAAAFLITASLAASAAAQSTIFVVRHAERADAGMTPSQPDPDLSAIGHERAQRLARLLKDAGVDAIFVTHLKRTQQTAAPLAAALGFAPQIVPAGDTPVLLERLRQHQGTALVVGHSNTVPEIVKALGQRVVTVADDEFDRVFAVIRAKSGEVTVVALRFD